MSPVRRSSPPGGAPPFGPGESPPPSVPPESAAVAGDELEQRLDMVDEADRDGSRARALRRFHEEDDPERIYDLRNLTRLWAFVRPHRAYLAGSALLLLVAAVLALIRPLVMRRALDAFEQPGAAAQLHQFGLLLAALIVVEYALAFPQMYWMQIAGARGMADLRRHIFAFLHRSPLSFFDRTPLGRLVTRVTNDVDAIGEMFASGALNAFGDLIRLAAIVVIMASIDWQMSLFAFAVLPPVMLGVDWTRRRVRRAYREVRAKTARLNAFVNEQVTGIAVVQAYAREEQSEREFDEINGAYRMANTRAVLLEATLDASLEMVSSICIAGVLWYAGGDRIASQVSFGTLFAFVVYIDMFFLPVRHLSARYTQIQSALAGAERIFQLLDMSERDAPSVESEALGATPSRGESTGEAAGAPAARDANGASWPGDEPVALELEQVSFAYKPGTEVLHDISLSVRRGETVALVGATGSGKTTIVSLLLRLYETGAGAVRVFGRSVQDVDRQRLRRQFAVVPQDVFLFPGTVLSNVAAVDVAPDRDRVLSTLDRIGAASLFQRREQGLDAPVLERGQNFSAGERQLIALARALYRDPPVLVLDEPTANIDSDTEARLQAAMNVATQGRTALIIAHRLSTVRSVDRIVVLHHGRIVEQGTHDELLAIAGVYARLHRLATAREAIAAATSPTMGSRSGQQEDRKTGRT